MNVLTRGLEDSTLPVILTKQVVWFLFRLRSHERHYGDTLLEDGTGAGSTDG